jgi:hypothetical protein
VISCVQTSTDIGWGHAGVKLGDKAMVWEDAARVAVGIYLGGALRVLHLAVFSVAPFSI